MTVARARDTIVLGDWKLDAVKRQEAGKPDSFVAVFESAAAKKMKYQADDTIIIEVKPTGEDDVGTLTFQYRAVIVKKAMVVKSIVFERVK